jgi:hypothetical protein
MQACVPARNHWVLGSDGIIRHLIKVLRNNYESNRKLDGVYPSSQNQAPWSAFAWRTRAREAAGSLRVRTSLEAGA